MRLSLPALALIAATALGGCTSSEPVLVGPETYMLTGTGAWSWSSGDALAGDLYRNAEAFCQRQGNHAMPVSERSVDGSLSRFAQASLRFRCLAEGDPELRRPRMQRAPDVVIEDRRG